jgi:hypothetical protein
MKSACSKSFCAFGNECRQCAAENHAAAQCGAVEAMTRISSLPPLGAKVFCFIFSKNKAWLAFL